MFLTDEQWALIEPHLGIEAKSGFGGPRADCRRVSEAVLFMLHTGVQSQLLQRSFPPKSRVHDYLQCWCRQDKFWWLRSALIRDLLEGKQIAIDQGFVDATFAPAKGGGAGVGLTRKGKGTKIQVVVDSQGLPLGVSVASADTGERQMVQQTLDLFIEDTQPERLIGDKGYDSDPLDAVLADLGIEMIASHCSDRRPENRTQEGRPLRRCRRRWMVERTIAWHGYHRRLLVRWEKSPAIFVGFALLGCLMITLKKVGA